MQTIHKKKKKKLSFHAEFIFLTIRICMWNIRFMIYIDSNITQ